MADDHDADVANLITQAMTFRLASAPKIRGKPGLLVLGMGGTFDKDYPRAHSGYSFEICEPAAERMLASMPFLGVTWRVQSVCKKDSTELTDVDRDLLVAAIRAAPEPRIVITHGTDTLAETAQYVAVSGVAAGKAVVVTGAMKPERFKDSDAAFNFGTAVGATALLPNGSVALAMGGQVIDCKRVVRDLETGLFLEQA